MVSKSNIKLLFFLVSFCVLYVGCGSPPPVPSLKITTSSPLPNAQVGKVYAVHLKASGGEMPLTWSGNPPANLKLEPYSGKITGSPDRTGSFRFEVTVSDNSTPARSASKIFELTINPNVPLAIFTQSILPSAGIKNIYTKMLQTTGAEGKLTWSSSNLTDDFALDPNTGTIKGIPERIGIFTFDVKVTDSANQCVAKRFVLGVLDITTDSPLPEATEGQEYSSLKPFAFQAAVGNLPFKWSGTLPANLTLNAETGEIHGTPVAAGEVNFDVTVTDSSTPQQSVSKAFQLHIKSAQPVVSTNLTE